MYTIEINYQTGNSFGRQEETENIGWVFDTKEEARLVLSYIKEHYEMYKALNAFDGYNKRKLIIAKYQDKDWFIKIVEGYSHDFEYSFKYLDRQISCFWCGYFETLFHAKIIVENKKDDKDCYTPSSY